jgi:hypothetical protein
MACKINSGVMQTPLFRIKVNSHVFDEDAFINLFTRLGLDNLVSFSDMQSFVSDVKKVFSIMGSGKYVFCSLVSPAQFKLLENEKETLNEKYRKVEVVRTKYKASDITFEAYYYDLANKKYLLEYLFFVVLYRFRSYLTFDVYVDYMTRTYLTLFGYNFRSCVMSSFEVGVEQEINEVGIPDQVKVKPFKVKMNVIPYDITIRL